MYCIAFDTKGYIKDFSCFTSLHNCNEILDNIYTNLRTFMPSYIYEQISERKVKREYD